MCKNGVSTYDLGYKEGNINSISISHSRYTMTPRFYNLKKYLGIKITNFNKRYLQKVMKD